MIQTQVPLTDDSECEGGHLLFACGDGRLMHVQRRVGSIMAHDGDAVHGVTQLVKGIRCRQLAGNECAADCSSMFLQTRPLPYVITYINTVLAPRYGLYALRGRLSATLVPLFPPLLLGVKGGEGTHSDRQQVFNVFCVAGNPRKAICIVAVV